MAQAHGNLAIGMVTTDCADPKVLAAFWTAALNTTVSGDYGEFVMLAPPPAGGPVLGERGGDAEGFVWTTLTDPEGNEFCLAEH